MEISRPILRRRYLSAGGPCIGCTATVTCSILLAGSERGWSPILLTLAILIQLLIVVEHRPVSSCSPDHVFRLIKRGFYFFRRSFSCPTFFTVSTDPYAMGHLRGPVPVATL